MNDRMHTASVTPRGADQASDLLKQVFRSFDGSVALRLWNGTTLRLGKAGPHASDPPGPVTARVRALFDAYVADHVARISAGASRV